ncbi:MAG: ATP-binding protein [Candidatus Aenigmatarchaeota archaeon]
MYEIIVGRDPSDVKKLGTSGTAFLGKHIVGLGEEAHLTNKIVMDVLRPHVILICGKRGTGKSYTAAVIAEEISALPDEFRKNLSVIIVDPMGIYWSMKNPNDKESDLLRNWEIKPSGVEATIFVPKGQEKDFEAAGIIWDKTLTLSTSEFSVEDWLITFNLSMFDPVGILLERCVRDLKKAQIEYDLPDIIRKISEDQKSDAREKESLINRFELAQSWGLFEKHGTDVEELMTPGGISVIDVSHYEGWSVKNLLMSMLAKKIYHSRLIARKREEIETMTGEAKKTLPMVWIIMDEAHQFLPNDAKTAASDALLSLVKQGREPGISTVFITQQPYKLHPDALSQADIVISHRLTAEQDIKALRSIMQTYLLKDVQKSIEELPKWKGSAIVLDDNSEKLYSLSVRPRFSWHAGGSPLAFRVK